MLSYVLRRLVSVAVTFIVVSLIIFLMMHSIPGGPFDANDMPVSAAVRDKLMAQLGLDQPSTSSTCATCGACCISISVCRSSPGETVVQLLSRAWVPSLVLGGLGVVIGAPWASCSAWPRPSIAIPGSTMSPLASPRSASPSRCS